VPTRFEIVYLHHRFALGAQPFTVGRSDKCELPIDDGLASRRHATFTFTDGRAHVEDLGSLNGVQLNGKRITGRAELKHGDVVTIGRAVIDVVGEA
jgi:pSer/pThr/pTyr-binding forkhead associated (FHA) protein